MHNLILFLPDYVSFRIFVYILFYERLTKNDSLYLRASHNKISFEDHIISIKNHKNQFLLLLPFGTPIVHDKYVLCRILFINLIKKNGMKQFNYVFH